MWDGLLCQDDFYDESQRLMNSVDLMDSRYVEEALSPKLNEMPKINELGGGQGPSPSVKLMRSERSMTLALI